MPGASSAPAQRQPASSGQVKSAGGSFPAMMSRHQRARPRGLTVLQSHAPIGYLLGRMEASLPLEDTRFGARPWTTSRGSAA